MTTKTTDESAVPQYVLVEGGPINGFTLTGPFPSAEAADAYGGGVDDAIMRVTGELNTAGYWVVELHKPDDSESGEGEGLRAEREYLEGGT